MFLNFLYVFAIVFFTNFLVGTYKIVANPTGNLFFWCFIVSLVASFAIAPIAWRSRNPLV